MGKRKKTPDVPKLRPKKEPDSRVKDGSYALDTLLCEDLWMADWPLRRLGASLRLTL
jgi:hypothetical protein